MSPIPDIINNMSAGKVIGDMAKQIEEWRKGEPEGCHLVMMMTLPDGRLMEVEEVAAIGHNAYRATGYVDELRVMVTGHVGTLQLFGSYEKSKKGQQPAGFRISVTPAPDPE